MLTIRDLTVGHGNTPVLSGINLNLSPGTLTAILGPNGGGKSTFLNTLAGVIPSLAGMAIWNGQNTFAMVPKERAKHIALVPQREEPAFQFSVLQMVLMGCFAHSSEFFDTPEEIELARTCLERMDARHLEHRNFGTLSGGERQRVLIARGLAQQTPVLLLDEPTAHLDLAHRAGFFEWMGELRAEGKAVAVAVHDVQLAFDLADQIALFGDGRVWNVGTPDSVRESGVLAEFYGASIRWTEFEGRKILVP